MLLLINIHVKFVLSHYLFYFFKESSMLTASNWRIVQVTKQKPRGIILTIYVSILDIKNSFGALYNDRSAFNAFVFKFKLYWWQFKTNYSSLAWKNGAIRRGTKQVLVQGSVRMQYYQWWPLQRQASFFMLIFKIQSVKARERKLHVVFRARLR